MSLKCDGCGEPKNWPKNCAGCEVELCENCIPGLTCGKCVDQYAKLGSIKELKQLIRACPNEWQKIKNN